jgi:ADP-ribosylglycohydrolase
MSDVQQTELGFTENIPIERVHGALLGAAVGDALGWPQEQNSGRMGSFPEPSETLTFQPWRRKGGYRYAAYEEHIKAGEYSDDTQLLIATARSILHGKHWGTVLSKHELPLWLLYERGGGGATKRAARAWLSGGKPWAQPKKQLQSYFNAGGNGVAMRILPHVLKPGQARAQMMRDVMRNGILTHGHPRALLGAIVYAHAAWWITHTSTPLPFGGAIQDLLDQRTEWEVLPRNTEGSTTGWLDAADHAFPNGYEVEWKRTVQEICDGLTMIHKAIHEQGALLNDRAILERLGCFGKTNGSGVVATLAVLYLFSVHASDPVTGLRTIAFAKSADTDTLASMLGGLFGLVYGLEWIPTPLQHVQDHDLIRDIADRLTRSSFSGEGESIPRWSDQDTQQVIETLQASQAGARLPLGILGNAEVISHRRLEPITRTVLRADEWYLRTDTGQTIYMTQPQRAPSSAPSKKQEAGATPEEQETPDTAQTDQGLSEETVQAALGMLKVALQSPTESPEALHTLITDQWDNLADADQEAIVARLERFIQVVREAEEQ